jgi:hypothetical protein
MLLARLYESFPLTCARCGAERRLIAFVTDSPSITRILDHLGKPPRPPPLSPARGPPGWAGVFDLTAPAPTPDFEFDQRVSW